MTIFQFKVSLPLLGKLKKFHHFAAARSREMMRMIWIVNWKSFYVCAPVEWHAVMCSLTRCFIHSSSHYISLSFSYGNTLCPKKSSDPISFNIFLCFILSSSNKLFYRNPLANKFRFFGCNHDTIFQSNEQCSQKISSASIFDANDSAHTSSRRWKLFTHPQILRYDHNVGSCKLSNEWTLVNFFEWMFFGLMTHEKLLPWHFD